MKKNLFIMAIMLFSLSACTQPQTTNGKFLHTVFFWLKNPKDVNERKAFEASLTTFLNSSKYISSKHLGVPASTNRPIIDTTYTYCLSLSFASKAEHDKYQEEEVHKVFIKESENLWEKVLIYDSENILKD